MSSDRLREIPDESVQCVATSPPYFGLRDYGVPPTAWPAMSYTTLGGQIDVDPMTCCLGLEPDVAAFIGHLVLVFREVHRVLRKDGTCWINLGDSYVSRGGSSRTPGKGWERPYRNDRPSSPTPQADLKPKEIIGAPWMLAFALRGDGWWVREDDIWSKPTPMPEPVADRCTRAHEYLFRMVKGQRYFADQDAIREPLAAKTLTTFGTTRGVPDGADELVKSRNYAEDVPDRKPKLGVDGEPVGANKRSVWTVRGTAFPEAHFATFPPEFVEPMILSATSPTACGTCAAPWRRIVERQVDDTRRPARQTAEIPEVTASGEGRNGRDSATFGHYVRSHTRGWEPTCEHDDPTGRCIVLDPFSGAGTTAMVALRRGRSAIGIELSADYAALSRRRIIDDAPLLNGPAEATELPTIEEVEHAV